jgi:hypothetical protein
VPYQLCTLAVGDAFRDVEFHDPAAAEERCRLLVTLVETEGPVHVNVATRRLREAWGVERTGERVRRAVEEAIGLCVHQGTVQQRGDFLWPAAARTEFVRARPSTLPDLYREYIAPEELQEALRLLVGQGLAMPAEVLFSEAASLFGYGRLGEAFRQRLEEQLGELLTRGVLVEQDGQVALP